MKKITLLMLLLQNFVFAQNQDLVTLAKGNYMGFNAVFDQKDNLYGYVALYGYGKSGEKTKKFEYVILDKNLNPVANKEFEGDITVGDYYAYMDFRGKIILRPTSYDNSQIRPKDFFEPFSMEIDPKTNEIKRKIYLSYDGTSFSEINQPKASKEEKKEDKAEKKAKGYNYRAFEYEIKEGGILVSELNDYGEYVKNNSLIRFDAEKKEMWRFKYNTDPDKKKSEDLKVIAKDEKNIYAFLRQTNKRENVFSFLVIDMVTGKELQRKDLGPYFNKETMNSLMNHNYEMKVFDDKIVLVGTLLAESIYAIGNGYVRFVINKETLDIVGKDLKYKRDLIAFVPKIDENGGVEGDYRLIYKDIFLLKDGSVGILMEKYKPQGNYSASKTTDLVYVYTNNAFEVKGVKIFEKEKTKWFHSDYLFSQYINEGSDVVFFYKDNQKDAETKEKNWNLFINTLIAGEFKQEQIPISSKENIILPYVAKEGYILLQEFNKKEKYNKIRLERLNY
jgi:hypothetical protein